MPWEYMLTHCNMAKGGREKVLPKFMDDLNDLGAEDWQVVASLPVTNQFGMSEFYLVLGRERTA